MPVIVISGKPGCGSSTNAKLLAKKLKLKHFSVGDYNKRHAKEAKKETDKSLEMWHHKEKYLRKFHIRSDKFANEVAKKGNVVIDAKLGIHLIKKHDLTVWLTASKKVQAERCARRDNIPVKDAMKKVVEKESLERNNWKRIYGFDYFDQAKEADLVINTGDKTPTEITDVIISKFNEKIFQKILVLALPYQDKRDDKGHVETVTQFSKKLILLEEADPMIVIPAAILHDIGWSKLSKKDRFSIFKSEVPENKRTFSGNVGVRIKHQKEGVKLAERILKKLNYNKELVPEILEIISEHDTRAVFISKNEGIMRDADKLWRFSRKGFIADMRRRRITNAENLRKMNERIEQKGFFYSKSAKKLAREELKKRKTEFKI